jgi:4-alpha-glucanotransferase
VTSGSDRETGELRRLARLRGVQTAYFDIRHRRRAPGPETLLAVLRALGEPLETVRDAPEALRTAEKASWERLCPPVTVAWIGAPAELELRLPRAVGSGRARLRITPETGEIRESDCDLSLLPAVAAGAGLAGPCVAKRVPLPPGLPPGYHTVQVETGGTAATATVLSAPSRAWHSPVTAGKEWGVFLPLYALHTRRSAGAGDLADLRTLIDWVAEMGGDVVATLPLLAACSPEPFDPSPYAPCSRLAWNEFYLDVTAMPGFAECAEAREIAVSDAFRAEMARLRQAPRVDYRAGLALKRRVTETVARQFFGNGGRPEDYRRFLAENPWIEEYAAFRAAWEARTSPWPTWPARLRDGRLQAGDFDESARQCHLFAQWALHLQLRALSSGPLKRLYLDLPLGTSYDGFDVWRHRDRFALDASVGAPPDDFFTRGQDWGFPPPNPERTREDGHAYFRSCIATQLRYAGILRIDHVMGLHRHFWIPKGACPEDGTYVRCPADELYAVLCVESHRHRARIVGEDLGTVPPYVRPEMARRGLRRMFVVQFGLSPDPHAALPGIPKASVACVNTHDMPPFAAFWGAGDIDDRVARGLLDADESAREKDGRAERVQALARFLQAAGWVPVPAKDGAGAVLRGCLRHLASSRAETVIVSLEDLWLEEAPQNTPGTSHERPNWVRKSRYTFEEFRSRPEVVSVLRDIGSIRKGGDPPCGTT